MCTQLFKHIVSFVVWTHVLRGVVAGQAVLTCHPQSYPGDPAIYSLALDSVPNTVLASITTNSLSFTVNGQHFQCPLYQLEDSGETEGTHSVRIYGGSLDDNVQIVGNKVEDLRIFFLGHSGDDTFDNLTLNQSEASGGLGNDTLLGGYEGDILRGHEGDDDLRGRGGNDSIYGGSGDDQLRGNNGDDTLDGGLGWDRIWGGAGDDRLSGSRFEPKAVLPGGTCVYFHDGQSDVLNGGPGADELYWRYYTLNGGSLIPFQTLHVEVLPDFNAAEDTRLQIYSIPFPLLGFP